MLHGYNCKQGKHCKPCYKETLRRPEPFGFLDISHPNLSFSFKFNFMKFQGQDKPLSGQEELNTALSCIEESH